MQKKIIALAVAGLVSGAAFAQSNVTIYGVADYGYIYADGDRGSFSGIDEGVRNGNRIGFKGEEALGNGLKVVFVHELGIDDTFNNPGAASAGGGGGINFTRKSIVGLAGSFGQVSLGRQLLPSDDYVSKTNASENSYLHANNMLLGNAVAFVGGVTQSGGERRNNMVKYESPNWSGWSTNVAYSFGENNGDKTDVNAIDYHQNYDASNEQGSAFGWGVDYNANNLRVNFGYQTLLGQHDIRNAPDTRGSSKNTQEYWVGAAYDFKVVRVGAGWVRAENKARGLKTDVYNISATIPTSTQGKVIVEVAQSKMKADRGANPNGNCARATGGFNPDFIANLDGRSRYDGGKTTAFSVGYEHELSKRTVVYSGVSYLKNNENGINRGFKAVTGPDDSAWATTVGLRHNF